MSILLCGDKISCHLSNNSSIVKDLLFEYGSMWGGEGFKPLHSHLKLVGYVTLVGLGF
jgi:hypothetical protein